MKLILVFASIVLAYLSPMYFIGDLSMPMLLEAGIRSGIIVTVCKWASQDFKELLIIVYLELILIACCAIIIADWHTHYIGLDTFISEINAAVFWLEIGILTILGGRRIGAYIFNDLHNSNPNLRGNDR
ncbi:MAG: hypothetical protein VW521_09075 [Rhodospirillales bacterium]|jgi:hypothetical protein